MIRIAMFGLKGIPCPGGAENVAEQLGSRLVQRGHEVTIYVRPHYTPRNLTAYRGMRFVHLPSIPTKNFDAITHSTLACMAVLLSGADIVHIHSQGNSIFAPLLSLRGIHTVVQSHGLDWQRAKWGRFAKGYLKLTDYTTVHCTSATTVVSKKLQQFYQDRYGREVFYIPNGVSPVEKAAPKEIVQLGLKGGDYILFAARLVPEKGAHYLVEAYRRLACPGKKLVIAGDSHYGDPYASRLKSLACENILFPGFVRGRLLQELLSNAYLYVLPSEIEGLSTGLLEAMSYGNCVLVSDIEENREAAGDCGVTFRSKSADDLADKLSMLLQHEDIVWSYKNRARDYITRRYNWDEVTDQYEALYRSLLSSRKGVLANAS